MDKITYEQIFTEFFSSNDNYYSMLDLYINTLELYVDLLILVSAYSDVALARNEGRVSPYVHLEKYIQIYSDSYMVKLRQIFSPKEKGMAHDFYKNLITINNRKYYTTDQKWFSDNYKGGVIDRYQKLEFHSNQHLKYYKITHRIKYNDRWSGYFKTPNSIELLRNTMPYMYRLSKAIRYFRKNSGIEDIGYEAIDVYEHVEEMERVFNAHLTQDEIEEVFMNIVKLNKNLFLPFSLEGTV